jgi:hypothetical protein
MSCWKEILNVLKEEVLLSTSLEDINNVNVILKFKRMLQFKYQESMFDKGD